jgi:large subunit ribosomal protein L25
MKHFELKGQTRQVGNKATIKAFRKQGLIPCNLYGNGVDNILFTVDAKEFGALISTPYSHIVDLNIEGECHQAVLKAIQYHPVTDRALHVDFLALDPAKPVTIEVPIKITGNSIGVRQGGKLNVPTRKLKVCGMIENLPDELPVDITELGLGKQINAGDLKFDGFQIVSPKGTLVCAVRATRNSAAAATEAAQ